MPKVYAHSGARDDRSDWQLLDDHLRQTADLARGRAVPSGLAASAALAGAFHDFGKNDPAFDRVLQGRKEAVDHSTAGGKLLLDRADQGTRPTAEVLAHAILGHHAGLPDSLGPNGSVSARTGSFVNRIPGPVTDSAAVDLVPATRELIARVRKDGRMAFDLSVAGRMVFSCLVDADFRDTEAFHGTTDPDQRIWPALADVLPSLRAAFDAGMARFDAAGALNRLRAEILNHVRAGAALPPGLFTLTVPTGGGKTLASMGFALDHAARHGHRRIIYAIPYTSIIDQTAATFRALFGDLVLEHHSAIETEKPGQEGRDKLRLAMEDWASPIIVTTNVQLFESLFAARPSRCRKLHNIARSIIILDEAQCLPRPLLAPTLRMIDALAVHYGCTIVLCTATQPAFDSTELDRNRKAGFGLDLAGRELAPDPGALARRLRRARIVDGGTMDDAALHKALESTPQGLVIVNSRKHAVALFRQVQHLPGALHLTTRQYPAHRRRIIEDVKTRLAAGAPCRLIATSLVEAGVDLSFPRGWRAEAGLDSIIQAAGRVNREDRWPVQDSTLTVFSSPDNPAPREVESLALSMRRTLARFGADAILDPEAIRDWFADVYWKLGPEQLDRERILDAFALGASGLNFAYRSVAEAYRMVNSPQLPVIIQTADSRPLIARLGIEAVSSGRLARDLQPFTVTVPARARENLRATGRGSFHAQAMRGDQFFVLDSDSFYRDDIGLWWEGAEELSDEEMFL